MDLGRGPQRLGRTGAGLGIAPPVDRRALHPDGTGDFRPVGRAIGGLPRLRAGATLRLQPHHPEIVSDGPVEKPGPHAVAGSAHDRLGPVAHGGRRRLLVAVAVASLVRLQHGHALGVPRPHRAAVQHLQAPGQPGPGGPHRGPVATQRLRQRRHLRHGRFRPLHPRQRLLHGIGGQQAHRVLRHLGGATVP